MGAASLKNPANATVKLLCVLALAGVAGTALGAKPVATGTYADVQITFGGQTFEFAGVQQSFSETQDGGRVVFDLTVVGTPGFEALPAVDPTDLPAAGNHWEVVSKVNNRSYSFVGTCASLTFTAIDSSGAVVRQLFLNCRDLTTATH
jgi:hypothetical protein